jgi:4-carboxymuconolactone decarboxylase
MKSFDRVMPQALEDTPQIREVMDNAVRAATHIASLPRDEVPSPPEDRRARGLRALGEITGSSGESVVAGLRDLAPDLADWIIDFSYGDVMARAGLERRTRQLATIAALTALGNAAPQLEVHIQGALNVGCTRQEIIEVIVQMAVYAGFPAAINGLAVARKVLAARPA